MDKYYISINTDTEMKALHLVKDPTKKSDILSYSGKQHNSSEISKIPDPSPKTMKRNKSRDNFIKFQWSWTL